MQKVLTLSKKQATTLKALFDAVDQANKSVSFYFSAIVAASEEADAKFISLKDNELTIEIIEKKGEALDPGNSAADH